MLKRNAPMSAWNRTTFTSSANRWVILPRIHLTHEERGQGVHPSVAASMVDEWCADAARWPQMHALYEQISGSWLRPPTTADVAERVKPALRRAFEQGRLVALKLPRFGTGARGAEEGVHTKLPGPAPKPPDVPRTIRQIAEKEPVLSFIEIALVDEENSPVPGEPYEIVLADGDVRSGTLDGRGKARLDGIAPGACQVKFPQLDGRDWAG